MQLIVCSHNTTYEGLYSSNKATVHNCSLSLYLSRVTQSFFIYSDQYQEDTVIYTMYSWTNIENCPHMNTKHNSKRIVIIVIRDWCRDSLSPTHHPTPLQKITIFLTFTVQFTCFVASKCYIWKIRILPPNEFVKWSITQPFFFIYSYLTWHVCCYLL